jgi:hypothetical protein
MIGPTEFRTVTNMRRNLWLWLLWTCFLTRGLFYSSVQPLWNGFDEWAHFAVAQNISVTGHLIVDRNMMVSREINTSLQLAPLPRGMTSIPSGGVGQIEYWKLPQEEQSRRELALQRLVPELADEGAMVECLHMKQVSLRYTIGSWQLS